MNPDVGKESDLPTITNIPKRILVIGGGPAGLTSSALSAYRGHQVTLIEKDKVLGGQFRLAGIPPTKENFKDGLAYMTHQAVKAGVTIKTGKSFNSGLLQELKPEIVIVATGSRPLIPPIPGIDRENVVVAHDVLNDQIQIGETILIIGGGMIGIETADYLSAKGKKVKVVEITPRLGRGMGAIARTNILRRLKKTGVELLTLCEVKNIRGSKVFLVWKGREMEMEGVDTVVVATGLASQNSFFEAIQKQIPEGYLIGDAAHADNALAAVHDGWKLGKII